MLSSVPNEVRRNAMIMDRMKLLLLKVFT